MFLGYAKGNHPWKVFWPDSHPQIIALNCCWRDCVIHVMFPDTHAGPCIYAEMEEVHIQYPWHKDITVCEAADRHNMSVSTVIFQWYYITILNSSIICKKQQQNSRPAFIFWWLLLFCLLLSMLCTACHHLHIFKCIIHYRAQHTIFVNALVTAFTFTLSVKFWIVSELWTNTHFIENVFPRLQPQTFNLNEEKRAEIPETK